MGYIRQRKVRSDVEVRLLRWRLKQQRMEGLPKRRELAKLEEQAEREMARVRRELGVW